MNEMDEMVQKIMDYLRKNPDAGDTLEGITRWWLQSEKRDRLPDEVLESLEDLIKKGIIEKQEVRNGAPLYKVCKTANESPER